MKAYHLAKDILIPAGTPLMLTTNEVEHTVMVKTDDGVTFPVHVRFGLNEAKEAGLVTEKTL